MLTSRGWWLLVVVLSLLALGLVGDSSTLTLLTLTLLLWFLAEWLLFALRVRIVVPALHIRRLVADERGAVDTLWAGHTFQVRVEIELRHWLGLPFVRITDRVP